MLCALHHGGVLILRYALRALGYPAASLVTERLDERPLLKKLKDSLSSPSSLPNVFSGKFPKTGMTFLKRGGLLIAMLDHLEGRMMEVPIDGGGWRISTTSLRMARKARARVHPVIIREKEPWRFVIHIGENIPPDLLESDEGLAEAGKFLWRGYAPGLNKSPWDSCAELYHSLRS